MVRKAGRPSKTTEPTNAREKLINAAIDLIRAGGVEALTITSVLRESGLSNGTFYHHFRNMDDLMITIVKELSFDSIQLEKPLEKIPDRICELYNHLIDHYLNLGLEFMTRFYTPRNKGLASYMCEENGHFTEGTAMARCEAEICAAIDAGVLKAGIDAHELSSDICTIVKGCLFDWSLSDMMIDIRLMMSRMIHQYMDNLIIKDK